ncbi:hypothetical protein EX30DRAFT_112030 [Ascodesmis nigricans]|uniref:Uncharacterized protein n=1 Tax=Ascodesmis nigricans TaxID=341454 RepID=A0A4S2MST9_9PEZI|nr:hypothetical protein EX30DRAFT_112030 [Ascodesmis nigricans]
MPHPLLPLHQIITNTSPSLRLNMPFTELYSIPRPRPHDGEWLTLKNKKAKKKKNLQKHRTFPSLYQASMQLPTIPTISATTATPTTIPTPTPSPSPSTSRVLYESSGYTTNPRSASYSR